MSVPLIDQVSGHNYQAIALIDIRPNPHNPRRAFDDEALAELAESIKAHGILQPLVLTPGPDNTYLIVAGERRFRAAKLAGLTFVPAVVRELSHKEQLEIMLCENLQRADLDPIEEARGIRQLLGECDMTQAELAQRIGKSQPWVANRLRLLRLPESVLKQVESGELSPGHAQILLKYEAAPKLIAAAAKEIVQRKIPVAEVEQKALNYLGGKGEDYRMLGAYDQAFAARGCSKCESYREAGYQKLCLNPECYDKKQAEALAAKSTKVQEQTGGLTIDGLRRAGTPFADDWRLKRAWCADCEKCDKVKRAMPSYGDKPERICLDPECVERHINAAEKAAHREANDLRNAALVEIRRAAEEASAGLTADHLVLILMELLRGDREYGHRFGRSSMLPGRSEFLKERFGLTWPGTNWNDDFREDAREFQALIDDIKTRDVACLCSALIEWVLTSGTDKLGPALDLVSLRVDKPAEAADDDEEDLDETEAQGGELCGYMAQQCQHWVDGDCTNPDELCIYDAPDTPEVAG